MLNYKETTIQKIIESEDHIYYYANREYLIRDKRDNRYHVAHIDWFRYIDTDNQRKVRYLFRYENGDHVDFEDKDNLIEELYDLYL